MMICVNCQKEFTTPKDRLGRPLPVANAFIAHVTEPGETDMCKGADVRFEVYRTVNGMGAPPTPQQEPWCYPCCYKTIKQALQVLESSGLV